MSDMILRQVHLVFRNGHVLEVMMSLEDAYTIRDAIRLRYEPKAARPSLGGIYWVGAPGSSETHRQLTLDHRQLLYILY